MEDEWTYIDGCLTSNEAVEAYGGFQLSKEQLQELAAEFENVNIPMHAEHDLTRRIRTRHMRIWLDEDPSGLIKLMFSVEVHTSDLEHTGGVRPAMSITLHEPLRPYVKERSITIAADAAWFTDEAILEAADAADISVSVRPARAYQFGIFSDPQIYIAISMWVGAELGPNLLSSFMWDSAKALLAKRKTPKGGNQDEPSIFNLSVERPAGEVWTATVKSNDSEVLKNAFDRLPQSLAGALNATEPTPPSVMWNETTGEWDHVDTSPEIVSSTGATELADEANETGE